MTERRPDDEDDGRAAGNRSQTRAVPEPGSFPPRNTFGAEDPLRVEQAAAGSPPRPATGAKPAGIWGQTIALGAAVPPAQHPHAAPPGPAPRAAEPAVPVQRAVVVMPAVHAGQPPRAAAQGQGHGATPPAPQADRGQRQPPARHPATDSDRPAVDPAHAAAEPLRVPSQRPAPAPFRSSQRGAPKGTLLMSGLGSDSRPAGATPVAARPPAAQTVPLGGDGKLERAAAPSTPATPPSGPGATRPLRPAAARARDEAEGLEPELDSIDAPPHGDLSFAATMPSVPPSAIPPQASAPSPPRTSAPARAAQPGRDQIHLQLDDADFVQRAPSSIPAGVPRHNPMLIVGGGLVLVLLAVIGWFLMRSPAPPPATVPAAEPAAATPVAPVAPLPTGETAPAAATTALGGSAATPTPEPTAVKPEPVPSAPKASAEPVTKPTATKTAARRPSKSGKNKAAPSSDVSAARDALRALEREPILKVKPSKEDSDDGPAQLEPADAPSMAPPAPGE